MNTTSLISLPSLNTLTAWDSVEGYKVTAKDHAQAMKAAIRREVATDTADYVAQAWQLSMDILFGNVHYISSTLRESDIIGYKGFNGDREYTVLHR